MTLLGAIIGIAIGRNHDVDISSIDGDPLTMLILGPFIAVAFALAKIALMAVYATVGGGVGMCFGLAISTADRTRPKLTHVSPPHASDSAESR